MGFYTSDSLLGHTIGFIEGTLDEGTDRDFPVELSTDEQARHNLGLWELLGERGELRKIGVDSQCSHYSLF